MPPGWSAVGARRPTRNSTSGNYLVVTGLMDRLYPPVFVPWATWGTTRLSHCTSLRSGPGGRADVDRGEAHIRNQIGRSTVTDVR